MTKDSDYPRIVVPPPGPNARAIIERDAAWASTSYIKEYPLAVARGQGAMIEDVDGNRYLDFMAGIAVAATGHAHPKVVAAVQEAGVAFPPYLRDRLLLRGNGRAVRAARARRARPEQEARLPHELRHRGG